MARSVFRDSTRVANRSLTPFSPYQRGTSIGRSSLPISPRRYSLVSGGRCKEGTAPPRARSHWPCLRPHGKRERSTAPPVRPRLSRASRSLSRVLEDVEPVLRFLYGLHVREARVPDEQLVHFVALQRVGSGLLAPVDGDEDAPLREYLLEASQRLEHDLPRPVVQDLRGDDEVEGLLRHLLRERTPLDAHVRVFGEAFTGDLDSLLRGVHGEQFVAAPSEHCVKTPIEEPASNPRWNLRSPSTPRVRSYFLRSYSLVSKSQGSMDWA